WSGYELGEWAQGRGPQRHGHRMIPAALKPFDELAAAARGLMADRVVRGPDGTGFAECAAGNRTLWMEALVAQVRGVLVHHADPRPAFTAEQQLPDDAFRLDREGKLLLDVRGRATALDNVRRVAPEPTNVHLAVPAVDYVLDWLANPASPPLFAL